MFDKWKSFLSLKTSVIVTFLVLWNGGLIIAMSVFGDGLMSPITPKSGAAIAVICLLAGIFGFTVSISEGAREILLEPKRSHQFRKRDFYLLGFLGFALAAGMYFFPT